MAEGVAGSDVTVAVLNYNGRALLPVVLESLTRQTTQGFVLRVLDDCSTDDSLSYLRDEWPEVEVLPAERTLGISAAMARAVQTTSTHYLALLNNDVELEPGWLAEMVAELERHPDAAAADGKMLRFHERDVLDGAGDVMGRDGYPRRRGQGERAAGRYEQPGEVFSATGGAALYRLAAFEVVGPFDADLGAYYEDVDWGFRARLKGMPTRYVPTAVSYHVGSATTRTQPGRYGWRIVRNQLIVLIKDMPAGLALRNLLWIGFFQLKWLIFNVLHGLGRAHMRGLWAAMRALPATLRKRRAIQRGRTAPLRELQAALGTCPVDRDHPVAALREPSSTA